MKNFAVKLSYLFTVLFISSSLLAPSESLADTTSVKIGTWSFNFYKAGNNNTPSLSFTICGGGKSWGLAGPARLNYNGDGAIALDGKQVFVYGQLDQNSLITDINVIGQIITGELITGNYLNTLNAGTSKAKVEYGTFEAVYDGPACPL
jgi:hypothetical protein